MLSQSKPPPDGKRNSKKRDTQVQPQTQTPVTVAHSLWPCRMPRAARVLLVGPSAHCIWAPANYKVQSAALALEVKALLHYSYKYGFQGYTCSDSLVSLTTYAGRCATQETLWHAAWVSGWFCVRHMAGVRLVCGCVRVGGANISFGEKSSRRVRKRKQGGV